MNLHYKFNIGKDKAQGAINICKKYLKPESLPIAALLLLVLMLFAQSGNAQLSGSYTIGMGGSYSTIGAAVNDLNTKGISGPVIFTIAYGTYNEQVLLNSVTGASATNTITFDGRDSSKTTMLFYGTSTAPYTFKLNGSKYVTIKRMSILNNFSGSTTAFAVHITGTANFNTIKSCIIKVDNTTTSTGVIPIGIMGATYSTAANNGNSNIIDNNIIDGGYINFVMYGTNTTTYCSGNSFTHNTLTGAYQYGIYSNYQTGLLISGNRIMLRNTSGATSSYGIYSYYSANHIISNNIINSWYMGIYEYYADYGVLGKTSSVINNIVYGQSAATSYGIYAYYDVNTMFYHNTVYFTASGGTALLITNTGTATQGDDVRNNIFYKTSSGALCVNISSSAFVTKLDYNDYYSSGGFLASFNGSSVPDISTLQSSNILYNQHSVNSDPGFANLTPGSEDLHMGNSSYGISGTNLGITTDIDGDTRCVPFPNMGADETTNGKGKPVVQFYITSNIYPGSPSYVYQTGKAGEPKAFHWYLNGIKVSDSAVLLTDKFITGSNDLKLVTQYCGGSDSFEKVFTLVEPKAPPASDFVASKNFILAGDNVGFHDLSTNGPVSWKWEVTSDSMIVGGVKVAAYKYIFGNYNTQNPQIKFPYPGKFKVCLTASNSFGNGNKLCRTDFIVVYPDVNIGSISVVHDAEGYLFDDGGPNGDYKKNGGAPSITIAPCADSVYLVFSLFDINCGVSFMQIYEGTNSKGLRLDPCGGSGVSTGFTGGAGSGACATSCFPNVNKPDTFKAKRAMFIQMNDGSTSIGRGFAAYWWSKPLTGVSKLKASFTSSGNNDSVCVNIPVSFVNTTKTSPDDIVSYLWDLDNDMSSFECIGSCSSAFWPYFLPGKVNVTLIATNCGGSDTLTKTLTVYNPKAPKTSFIVDNANPAIGETVFLTSTIPQCIENFKWTITKSSGYGTGYASYINGTSNISANPKVTFSDTGYYNVKLYADNLFSGQKDSLTINKFIHVRSAYCIPSVAVLNQGLGISGVTLNTIDNSTTQAQTEYSNFTSNQSLATTLAMSATYNLTVSRNSKYILEPINRSVFIDWNQDGSFTGKGEEAAGDSNSYSVMWTTKITVPKTAKLGATIMRIATNRGSYSNKPCGQNEFGEYQDYRIYITPYNILPVITLKGIQGFNDTIKIEQGHSFTDPGYSASSFLYGDISNRIIRSSRKSGSILPSDSFSNIVPGIYIFSYNVSDSIGNKAISKYRIVQVTKDHTPPVLIVDQPDTLIMEVTPTPLFPFPAPKVISAIDLIDGSLVSNVVNDANNIQSNFLGFYMITYSVTDLSGNTAFVYRYVKIVDTIKPLLTLLGTSPVDLEVNSPYIDAGVQASDNYYQPGVLNPLVKVNSDLNVSRLGSYSITYNLTDPSGNIAGSVTRIVKVIDTLKPLIILNGLQSDTLEVFSKYPDPGVTVNDNYDSPMDLVTVISGTFYSSFPVGNSANILGSYTIIYSVTDKSGNQSSISRSVFVIDRMPPVIALKGPSDVTLCRWESYKDEGFTVSDNYDKNTEITIDTAGTFITNGGSTIEGLLNLIYRATDKSGNTSVSDTRHILVKSIHQSPCSASGIVNGNNFKENIKIYPNPSNGKFIIDISAAFNEKVRISVTNLLGQELELVHEGVVSQNIFNVDLSSEPAGIYLIKITGETQMITKIINIKK